MFYGNLALPEFDKIQTIEVLLSVYCVSSMDWQSDIFAVVWCFYVSVTVYALTIFTYFCAIL